MNWYAKTANLGSPHEQGLIIDEETGDNIAVTYDPKHAPLIAAAPEMLAALEWLVMRTESERRRFPRGELKKRETHLRQARGAIAKAKEVK